MNNNTILVCDDSAIVRSDLRAMLERNGFGVLVAEDGDVAADLARDNDKISLCIIDYNMPTMNGLETMRAIRENNSHAEVPVFILTTECADNLIKQARDQGATAWIVKPWKEEPLLAGIEHAIGN
ncbi:MAG: response regulator [Deltaproteobacteria bacterium]|jgi:two-component system, chemotaxis family, chemotaxis protein CheY|nr:response regulator [Deltaproteobacteria bacterium]MBT6432153.1 response regulator [Deltaproteobacteria bacterium]MBT6491923.1 response regulator [Deltaproteobacteria bacterium]